MFDFFYGECVIAKESARNRLFTPVTISILTLACVLAGAVPSIWLVIGFIGSIGTTGEQPLRHPLREWCSSLPVCLQPLAVIFMFKVTNAALCGVDLQV